MAEAPQAPVAERQTPVTPPPFQLQPMAEKERYLKALFYGDYGVGKTTLAASVVDVPSMRDVLFLDIESGDLSITDSDRIKNVGDLDVIKITNFAMADKVKEWLTAHATFRDQQGRKAEDKLRRLEERVRGVSVEKPKRYRTLVVDTVSEVETFCMYGVLGINESMELSDDIPTAEWAEFKQNNNKMQILVRRLRDLPMHVLMTCACKWNQDEMKRYHYTLALTGQLSKQIQGFVDIVGYLEMAQPTEDKPAPRRLWVQRVGRFDAKCRWSSFKKTHFDDPTMLSILKAVGLEKG